MLLAMDRTTIDLLQGTLGTLILKAVSRDPLHGYGIARWIEEVTGDEVLIEDGSLYPALHRLQAMKLLTSEWGVSETGRRVKRYTDHRTRAGRSCARRPTRWDAVLVTPVTRALGARGADGGAAVPWLVAARDRAATSTRRSRRTSSRARGRTRRRGLDAGRGGRGRAPVASSAIAEDGRRSACRRNRPRRPTTSERWSQHADRSLAGPRATPLRLFRRNRRIRRRRRSSPWRSGMGATTTIFTLANWALLRPGAGRRRARERVGVLGRAAASDEGSFSSGAAVLSRTWPTPSRQTCKSMSLGAYQRGGRGRGRGRRAGGAPRLDAHYVDGRLLPQPSGSRMQIGRPFTGAEDTAARRPSSAR